MLHRTTHANSAITFQSPLLDHSQIRHAFSTRHGGVSAGPFASLNLGNPSDSPQQDSPANIAENYRRLQEALHCPRHTLRAWVRQVHGRSVELIEREPENEYAETLDAEIRDRFSGQISADALVCLVPNVLLTVRIADCVPILLASADGRAVAAIHAGWRGVVGNIIEKVVRTLQENGFPPANLLAAIGPAISAEHFEVGPEVAEEFTRQNLASAVLRPTTTRPKPHIDLQLAIKTQLERAGITQIDTNDLCTFRDAADFFSHRRDQGITGRMAAVIMCRDHPR
jgi:polyphenol oxidase